jgi:hypothetical protein
VISELPLAADAGRSRLPRFERCAVGTDFALSMPMSSAPASANTRSIWTLPLSTSLWCRWLRIARQGHSTLLETQAIKKVLNGIQSGRKNAVLEIVAENRPQNSNSIRNFMTQNLATPEAQDVDFNNFEQVLGKKACSKEFEDFDQQDARPVKSPPPAKQPNDDDGLLDLSDESTLDKLSAGGFLRIRPEGQNTVSVAFFKPAVQAKTHYSAERNKTIPCLQPKSDYCCKKLGEARDVIGVLAIQYGGASTKDGTLKKGTDPDLRVGYVTLSKSALASMRKNLLEGASLYSTDWKISKRSNGIGYEYSVQRITPAYKTLNLEKQVEELIAPYKDGVMLRKRVAKPMSVIEVRLLITGEVPELDDGKTLDDMETMY